MREEHSQLEKEEWGIEESEDSELVVNRVIEENVHRTI